MNTIYNFPNSKYYGDLSVSMCATYLLSIGSQVLMPFGDRGHYDLVSENDGKFSRIQCKWTSNKSDAGYYIVPMRSCSSPVKKNGTMETVIYKYTTRDLDFLWAATPEACYLIPVSEILSKSESIHSFKLFPKYSSYSVSMRFPLTEEKPLRDNARSPQLTEDDIPTIRDMLVSGSTITDIAHELNIHRSAVSRFVKKYSIC